MFEPGAQGEHKIARGFLPVVVRSRHHFTEHGLDAAFARWCAEERAGPSAIAGCGARAFALSRPCCTMTLRLPLLAADPNAPFPDPRSALREPDGLLAFGGDLSPARLLDAYQHGIFPWYADDQPILWWSPDPRTVFRSDGVHLSRRFRRDLRTLDWTIRVDTAFDSVVLNCANSPRSGQSGTWITPPMRAAYLELHRLGHAHAIEVWEGALLVGGLYGVAVGRMFFAESMFSAVSGGSKVAMAALAAILRGWGWPLFDAQVESPHLVRMGADTLPRVDFVIVVARQSAWRAEVGPWTQVVGQARNGLAVQLRRLRSD